MEEKIICKKIIPEFLKSHLKSTQKWHKLLVESWRFLRTKKVVLEWGGFKGGATPIL